MAGMILHALAQWFWLILARLAGIVTGLVMVALAIPFRVPAVSLSAPLRRRTSSTTSHPSRFRSRCRRWSGMRRLLISPARLVLRPAAAR